MSLFLRLSRLSAFFIFIIITARVQAQISQSGFVNFNVGRSPADNELLQPVTLFGCNDTIFETKVKWGNWNQVVGDIPYGPGVSKSGKEYFVSKYYVASPPAYRSKKDKQDPYIGLVIPDRFAFRGERPAQIVNLDYKILKPTFLKDIPVDFNYSKDDIPSCKSQKVTSIPINTVCRDFPWNIGAEGASGIGQLTSDGGTAFLPLLHENKDPLKCDVTLLDDVLLDHEAYFLSDRKLTKTVNLTELYEKSQMMKLVCIPRVPEDIPAGCVAPE